MVEPLRHRQTKVAVTDMFDLKPPRHTSTLPQPERLMASKSRPQHLSNRKSPGPSDAYALCHKRSSPQSIGRLTAYLGPPIVDCRALKGRGRAKGPELCNACRFLA